MPRTEAAVLAPELVGREPELVQIERALASARRGTGGAIAIEGPPGIGKTSLLSATRRLACQLGMTVLDARATELDRDLGWAVVRELFVPALRAASDHAREQLLADVARSCVAVLGMDSAGEAVGEAADLMATALHGLYWLAANLAVRAPLLVMVDDVQWCDRPSLRWLARLAPRLADLPCLVAVTVRAPISETDEYLSALVGASTPLVLSPLSEASGAVLMRGWLGVEADEEFCAACHRRTGGNPFLLSALAAEIAREGIRPVAPNLARVSDATPASVTRSVLLRIARLGEDARALAETLAVIGGDASFGEVARLADLPESVAHDAARALLAANVIAADLPLDFVHPIVRTAVYADLGGLRRGQLHGRAAAMLTLAGAAPGRIAAHLLHTEPRGDPDVRATLVEAAGRAVAEGAPDISVACLRRALREAPDDHERIRLLQSLAGVEASLGDAAAGEHLFAAYDLSAEPNERAEVALEAGRVLTNAGRLDEACDLLAEAIDAIDPADRDLKPRLQAELLQAAGYSAGTRPRVRDLIATVDPPDPAETDGERLLLARLAFEEVFNGNAERATALARRALADGRLAADEAAGSQAAFTAADALMLCDHLDEACAYYDQALAAARRRGSTVGVAFALLERSHLRYRGGDIPQAEADARATLNALELAGWSWGMAIPAAFLVDALVEQGRLTEAAETIKDAFPAGAARRADRPAARLLHSRGRLRIASGQLGAGADDLFDCGRILEALEVANPAGLAWRGNAVSALVWLDRREEAQRLAAQELALARKFGTPRAIGMALYASGVAALGQGQVAFFDDAVKTLERSPARLEHARALAGLGGALRRGRHRKAARETLAVALDLAVSCGATALAERVRTELVTAGARPRRERVTGPESLTGSELRVARMAADGLSNREIAASLFVSLRTVETHLTHAYQKLDITSRSDLVTVIEPA